MAEKNFAFESGKISIAFSLMSWNGLGDSLIAKKVFDALIELAPDCVIDIFVGNTTQEIFAKSFYSDSKNLNLILSYDELYKEAAKYYDLALWVGGSHVVFLDAVNVARLRAASPKLLESVIKIDEYNKKNVKDFGFWGTSVAFRNMMTARILNKSCFEFLSCDGALPIRDDKIKIPLAPEVKPVFESLKLGKYITIYSNIGRDEVRPKVKTWPMKYLVEYVSRMKKRFPSVEIIQVGGGGEALIENVDREALGCDLELTKYVLANSLLHVGCEGGLVHLATALGTKCLILFGSNAVEYFGYKQNINLVSEVCSPCMYILPDFRICLRGAKEPPCMLNFTPQTVCSVTCTYLKNNS